MAKYVIVGGHGKVARLLEPLLVEGGNKVVATIRDSAQTEEIEATGAVAAESTIEGGGPEAVDAFAELVKGADAVIWMAGAGGKGGPERTKAVDEDGAKAAIDGAKKAGVKRFVMVSFMQSTAAFDEFSDSMKAYAAAKLAADRYLAQSGLQYTIVGPGPLTDDEPSDKITVERTRGDASTSRGNVARVIQAVLANPRSAGKIIPFHDGDTPVTDAIEDAPADKYTTENWD